MAKKLKLQIPTPCHENWENMTKTEKGRFCAACQKQVIDFSNKSDREIAMFFKRPSSGSVCGRFMEDQLSRDIDIPKKRIPWLKYFFQFLIPTFFVSYRASAQGKVEVVSNMATQMPKLSDSWQNKKIKGNTDREFCSTVGDVEISIPSPGALNLIKGQVIDHNGNPVGFATVAIKGTNIAVAADSSGRFTIKPKSNWDSITLSTSCVGFVPFEKNIKKPDAENNQTIELQPIRALEEIVVTNTICSRYRKGMVGSVTWYRTYPFNINDLFKLKSNFRIYPNPIKPNSALMIEWKQKEFGDHLLQLFNQSGQLILSKDIYIDEKTKQFTINMPSVISGSYFLKLTSKANGKSYTEKLIVN